jgi:hypothetical protein
MSGYEGQPEYVRVGFQTELLGLWCEKGAGILPYDEWGREVEAMYALADAMSSCSDNRMDTVISWIWEELGRWHDDDPGEEWRDWEYGKLREIRLAQDGYEEAVEDWREQAKGFNGSVPGTETVSSDALEEVIASLPEWVKPDPNAEPLPDPEYEEYKRLSAKFEKSDE